MVEKYICALIVIAVMIKEIQKGNIDINKDFDKIYLLYSVRMRRFAENYLLSKEDAENVVQDIFIHILEKKQQLNITTSISSYLFTLTKNRCLDFLRHQTVADKYRSEYAIKLEALEELNAIDINEQEIESKIKEALEKLPPKCREIFVKSRFENKRNKDIAEELHIFVSTVETQISIALRKLKADLKEYLPIILFFYGVNIS